MLKGFVNNIYLPIVKEALELMKKRILDWSKITILTHTHGQPASPSFMGKELMVYYERFVLCSRTLNGMNYRVKFGGAIGNFNSLHMALPNIDWIDFSNKLMKILGIERNQYTTQINHNDNICNILDNIKRINNILLDLNTDLWLYISKNYFILHKERNQIGSSTMPHKINPINFENSEGNLHLANNILSFLSNKLPLSRLQRDLSNSTIFRNLGYPLSLSIISFKSFIIGFNNIDINKDFIHNELNNHFEIITEGIATRLKILGIYNSYESLLDISRNSNNNNIHDNINKYIQSIDIPEKEKKYLFTITPHNYTGIYKL
jgi:adenylosuccinate lyase